jgi:hypothetical protein
MHLTRTLACALVLGGGSAANAEVLSLVCTNTMPMQTNMTVNIWVDLSDNSVRQQNTIVGGQAYPVTGPYPGKVSNYTISYGGNEYGNAFTTIDRATGVLTFAYPDGYGEKWTCEKSSTPPPAMKF